MAERRPAVTVRRRGRLRPRPGRVLLYLVLTVGSGVMVYPLVYGSLASLCTVRDFYDSSFLCVPRDVTGDNYAVLFAGTDQVLRLWRWVLNTLIRVIWYIAVPGVVALLGGYVFARLRFRGRDTVFVGLLASMMFPPIVYLIPLYVIFARWPLAGGNGLYGQGGHGFIDSWPSLLIGGLVNAYYIFLFRQSFYSIPRDFEDAARVDGAGLFRLFRHVYIPMLAPSIAVMVIFQSVLIWNDYMWPLIVVSGNDQVWPIGLGFQRLMFTGATVKGQTGPEANVVDYPFAFTLAVLATIPLVILFLRMQRHFVEGMQGFALKG